MAAKISHSLPKPHEPIFLPSKSATESMPESAHDTWRVPERWKICAMSVRLAPGLDRSEHLRHPGDRVVDVAVGERVLRHDVAAGGDDLDLQALLLEEALLLRGEVAGELALRQPLELELDRRELAVGVVRRSPPVRRRRRNRRCRTSAAARASAPVVATRRVLCLMSSFRCSRVFVGACGGAGSGLGRCAGWPGSGRVIAPAGCGAARDARGASVARKKSRPSGDRGDDVRPGARVGARGRRRRDERCRVRRAGRRSTRRRGPRSPRAKRRCGCR